MTWPYSNLQSRFSRGHPQYIMCFILDDNRRLEIERYFSFVSWFAIQSWTVCGTRWIFTSCPWCIPFLISWVHDRCRITRRVSASIGKLPLRWCSSVFLLVVFNFSHWHCVIGFVRLFVSLTCETTGGTIYTLTHCPLIQFTSQQNGLWYLKQCKSVKYIYMQCVNSRCTSSWGMYCKGRQWNILYDKLTDLRWRWYSNILAL